MKNALLFVVLTGILGSCGHSRVDEERKIRALLKQEQTAHLTKDVNLFTSGFADGMIGVNRGQVTRHSEAQYKERFTQYFNAVEFIKWEDVADPIIRFSDDQSLAYAIIQKQVIVRSKDTNQTDTTDFAWISVFRKQDGEWKTECNVSTNKP